MFVWQRCPSHRESNKASKERQGPNLGVRLTEVSVLERVNKGSKESQGATLDVC